MKLLLTGASGFIGRHLHENLQKEAHDVVPISRRYGFDFNHMLHSEDWLPLLKKIDGVINSVGIITETRQQSFSRLHFHAPAALFRACERTSVKRIIQISALGADEQAFTPYQLSKKSADDVLRKSNLDWFILRPSLVYGIGGKSSKLFQKLASLPVLPVVSGGKQLIQPVHISDLVDTVLQCIKAPSARQTLDVIGPSPIRFIDWLQIMRRQQGKQPAPILNIPFRLALSAASLGQYLMPLIQPDTIKMLQHGNTSDVRPLAKFIGHMPRSVEEQTWTT